MGHGACDLWVQGPPVAGDQRSWQKRPSAKTLLETEGTVASLEPREKVNGATFLREGRERVQGGGMAELPLSCLFSVVVPIPGSHRAFKKESKRHSRGRMSRRVAEKLTTRQKDWDVFPRGHICTLVF